MPSGAPYRQGATTLEKVSNIKILFHTFGTFNAENILSLHFSRASNEGVTKRTTTNLPLPGIRHLGSPWLDTWKH